jgi:Na+-translocating ferredoxin:NAD+ oxidoreductase RnfA subunit
MIIASVLSFFWWVVIVIAWVMFLTVTMAIARSKGRSPLLWGLLAIFLPLITVIILLLIPDRSRG